MNDTTIPLRRNLADLLPFLAEPLVLTVGLAVVGAALAAFMFLQFRDRSRHRNEPEPGTLAGLRVFTWLLTPIWFLIVAHILYALVALALAFDPSRQGTEEGADLRWHVLAFVGLITALGALVSAPPRPDPGLDHRTPDPHRRAGPPDRPHLQGRGTPWRRKDRKPHRKAGHNLDRQARGTDNP
ncbi:hypothetical protein [Sagittula salina]|uniref:Uncharacterized protein n=1 Tax=Sagittula salina TaxID=2820268 RepID=A0A940MMC0_9RHOB|nr:hypothetical protein [Sagittula salina]MBP0481103.1 hypothetical protein [Sagittula salina]